MLPFAHSPHILVYASHHQNLSCEIINLNIYALLLLFLSLLYVKETEEYRRHWTHTHELLCCYMVYYDACVYLKWRWENSVQ